MHKKQCTVIIPVLNEMKSIQEFLKGIYEQTRQPDEIIIVDGGSKDGTYEFLKQEQVKYPLLTIISYPQSMPSQARNRAIKEAKHEIILCTDAGCRVDKHRCEAMMQVFEHTDEKLIWGKNGVINKTTFQKHAAHHIMPPENEKPTFFSSRNIWFYRDIALEVWLYPEYVLAGEDTYFNIKLQEKWYHFHYCPEAIVSRELRDSLRKLYRMFVRYTWGDAEIRVIHHYIQSVSIYQGIGITTFGILRLLFTIYFPLHGGAILLLLILLLWFHKHSSWGRLFDCKINAIKIGGIFGGFRKGVRSGYQIKRRLKRK